MRGLHPRKEPLTRLRFAKPPSPTRGEGKKHASTLLIPDSNFKQQTHFHTPAARYARIVQKLSPRKTEGAGNAGRPMRPPPRVRRSKVKSTRVSQVTPKTPGIPHAMVLTASFALSPVTGLSCHRHQRKLLPANLTPASGRQDHTTSPSASAPFVKGAIGVHRIPPRVRDDRETPLCGTGWRDYRSDLGFRKIRIFFIEGLDRRTGNAQSALLICPSGHQSCR
jgi:hypothetical protein